MQKHSTFACLFLIMVLLTFLPGASLAAQSTPLKIVASFSILADVVQNVAGEAADVTSLIPVASDPHTYAPTASDLTALADADVVFVNGAFFEEGLMEAIENAGEDMNIVVASDCIQILPVGAAGHSHDHDEEAHDDDAAMDATEEAHDDHDHEGEGVAMAEGDLSAMAERCAAHYAEMEAIHEAGHDHEGESMDATEEAHEHEEGEHEHSHAEVETLGALYTLECGGHDHEGEEEHSEEGEHEHAEGSCDPHVWQEAHNGMYWAMQIRDTLIALDPANAEVYTANAAAYITSLDDLAHDVIRPLVDTLPEEQRILVTSHETFGYFAAAYEFEIIGVVLPGGGTLAEPSAGDLVDLIEIIRTEGVPAIFAETTVSPDLIGQVSAETGAQVAVLYSDSLSEADGPAPTYVDLLRYNAETIVSALSR